MWPSGRALELEVSADRLTEPRFFHDFDQLEPSRADEGLGVLFPAG